MLYMAGIKVGENRIIEHAIKPKFSIQTVFCVKPDDKSALEALLLIDKYGMALYATLHLHPGRGILATCPSTDDIKNQTAWELGGYSNIMGIFSRDGFVRFLRFTDEFEVTVFGKEVCDVKNRCCDSKLFRLLEAEEIHRPEGAEQGLTFCY